MKSLFLFCRSESQAASAASALASIERMWLGLAAVVWTGWVATLFYLAAIAV
jgi:hypothetical protein